jgi:hypothetical protein
MTHRYSEVVVIGLLCICYMTSPAAATASPFYFATEKQPSSTKNEALQQLLIGSSLNNNNMERVVIGTTGIGLQVRGGALPSFNKSRQKTSDRYRQALEEQIQVIGQQLRQGHEELVLMKKQLSKRQEKQQHQYLPAAIQGARSSNDMSSEERKSLQQETSSLGKQVKTLENMKTELETMLLKQYERVQQLEALLEGEQTLTASLQVKYEKQMEQLQADLAKTTREQMEQIVKFYEERMAQAAVAAEQAVLVTLEECLLVLTARVQQETQLELQEERQRAMVAVEKQRQKMRQVAKALAQRENKIRQKEDVTKEQDQQKELQKRELLESIQEEGRLKVLEAKREQERLEKEAKALELDEKQQQLFAEAASKNQQEEEMAEVPPTRAAKREQVRLEKQAKALELKEKQQQLFAEAESKKQLSSSQTIPSKTSSSQPPVVHKAECWQRHVPWQPMMYPPQSVTKVSFR